MAKPNFVQMLAGAVLVATLAAGSAQAQEVFGGLYVHDARLGISVCCYEHGADVQLGLRSAPFADFGRWGALRAYGMGSVNTSGGVDFAAAGLAWRVPLGRRFYLQPGLGGAIQNGDADRYQRRVNHLDLGSRVLFEPELALGYRISPRWAAEASYIHLSHAQLAGPQNPGMDDAGLRLVYRFGG
jgi:lipid A 3-O-deacylase